MYLNGTFLTKLREDGFEPKVVGCDPHPGCKKYIDGEYST